MKNIKSKLTGWAAVAVAALLLPSVGRAQGNDNIYLNSDWQYNVPLGASFADKSSGWGMNFEGGYYFPNNFGVGAFIAYHTNNEYIPRQTFPVGETSTVTTDQQHSVFQLPFGATGRYRFLQTNVLEPYVALKLGANYARISSNFYILEAYEKTWGFYMSPEIGLNVRPFGASGFGFHFALYYSYATNSGTVLKYKTDQLNNFGFRIGVGF